MKKEPLLANLADDGWQLEDGVEAHLKNPRTFWIPSLLRRHLIWPGQIVKLMFRIGLVNETGKAWEETERMWVVVKRRNGFGKYEGVLDNDPYCTKGIQAGMKVNFEARHIIQIQ